MMALSRRGSQGRKASGVDIAPPDTNGSSAIGTSQQRWTGKPTRACTRCCSSSGLVTEAQIEEAFGVRPSVSG